MKLIARTLSAVAFVAASLLASHGTAGSVEDVVKAAEEIALHDAAGRVEAGGRAGFVPTALLAEAEVGPKAGETFRDCPSCPEMVVVPAGSFVMGSPRSEVGRDGDEVLQHEVTISQPFAVGKHEVTFAEWDTCVSAGGCDGYRPDDKGWGRGSRPVIHVNWNEARSYVAWLSRKTGKEYRLLTEAEWEYAARAKTRTRYSWGDSVGRNRANCRGCGSRWDGRETAPAGSFAANGFGLHDMSGNVSEWSRTAGTVTMRAHRRTAALGWRAVIAGAHIARRFVEQHTVVPPFRHPPRVQCRESGRHLRLPRCPDAYALSPYLFTSGSGGGAPRGIISRARPGNRAWKGSRVNL